MSSQDQRLSSPDALLFQDPDPASQSWKVASYTWAAAFTLPGLGRRWLTGARTKPYCEGCSHTCLKCVNLPLPPALAHGGRASLCSSCCSHSAMEVTGVMLPWGAFCGCDCERALLRWDLLFVLYLCCGRVAGCGLRRERGLWREGSAQLGVGGRDPGFLYKRMEVYNWRMLHWLAVEGGPHLFSQSINICGEPTMRQALWMHKNQDKPLLSWGLHSSIDFF